MLFISTNINEKKKIQNKNNLGIEIISNFYEGFGIKI